MKKEIFNLFGKYFITIVDRWVRYMKTREIRNNGRVKNLEKVETKSVLKKLGLNRILFQHVFWFLMF